MLSLPEGVALNFLIERAMEWQEKVRPLVNRYKGIYTATDKQSYVDQHISSKERTQIEELMIKGDLIELSMEETTTLWNLLNNVDECVVPEQKKKPASRPPSKPASPNGSAGSGSKRRKTPSDEKTKIRKKRKDRQSHNTDELCSFQTCLRPEGAQVGWIQCDKCEKWYHLECVSISHVEAEQIDDYTCPYHDSSPPATAAAD
eukprot:sb/3470578/